MASADKKVILGIGNPLLDISAKVGKDILDKYGLEEKSAILAESKHVPLYDELVKEHKVEYIAGGATQNSIRGAQWISQDKIETHYIGCVGKDSFGEQLEKAASADGVNVHYLVNEKYQTGTCAVLIHNSDRTLVANLGAANHYQKSHLDSDEIQKILQSTDLIYSAGFFLTVSPESLVDIGEHAVAKGKIFALNISAEFLVHAFSDPMNKVLPYVDLLFANEIETAAFGKKNNYGDDLKEITKKMAQLPTKSGRVRTVITTRGPDSAYVSIGGADCTEYPANVVPKSEIVDVNGAGDAFVGGFLSQYVYDKENIAKAMKAGHYAATCCIKVSGAQFLGKPEFK